MISQTYISSKTVPLFIPSNRETKSFLEISFGLLSKCFLSVSIRDAASIKYCFK